MSCESGSVSPSLSSSIPVRRGVASVLPAPGVAALLTVDSLPICLGKLSAGRCVPQTVSLQFGCSVALFYDRFTTSSDCYVRSVYGKLPLEAGMLRINIEIAGAPRSVRHDAAV